MVCETCVGPSVVMLIVSPLPSVEESGGLSQLGVRRARSNFHPPIRVGSRLAPEAQLLDQRAVALEILAPEVVQQAAAASYELEQTPSGVRVLRVGPQVLRELVEPGRLPTPPWPRRSPRAWPSR